MDHTILSGRAAVIRCYAMATLIYKYHLVYNCNPFPARSGLSAEMPMPRLLFGFGLGFGLGFLFEPRNAFMDQWITYRTVPLVSPSQPVSERILCMNTWPKWTQNPESGSNDASVYL